MILAVDLAAKFSAACLMTIDGKVTWQTDSWQKTEAAFVDQLTAPWQGPQPRPPARRPMVMVVEDLPHRLPFSSLVKRVCRLQGRILDRMDALGALDTVLFVPPAEWRRSFAGLERGTGPGAVTDICAALGYHAPDLAERCTQRGDKTTARKVATDYCAAYLIGRWAGHTYASTGTFDTRATTRYPE